MKHVVVFSFVLAAAVVAAPAGRAQSMGNVKDMDTGKQSQAQTHKASGTVTKMDSANSKVTISHGAVPTLKWPAMAMTFSVKDKALLGTLSPGKKIDFEFVQQGRDYVIVSAK